MTCPIHIYEKESDGKIIYCDDDEKEVILSQVHLIVRSEKVKDEDIPKEIIQEIEYEIVESEESWDKRPVYENEYYCVSDDDEEYYGYDDMIPDYILNGN